MIVERTPPRGRDVHDAGRAPAQHAIDLEAVELLPAPGSARRRRSSRRRPTRAATSRPPSRCGTRAGTSTRSTATGARRVRAARLLPQPRRVVSTPPTSADRAGPSVMLVDVRPRRSRRPTTTGRRSTFRTRSRPRTSARCRSSASRSRCPAAGAASRRRSPRRCAASPATRWRSSSTSYWETDGIPYAWRSSTRYEIPCRVRGPSGRRESALVLPGPGSATIRGARGTGGRSTGCGARLQLDDGTRIHGVQLRLPELPAIGVGYVQRRPRAGRARQRQAAEAVAAERADRERADRARAAGDRARRRAARVRRSAPAGAGRTPVAVPAGDVPRARGRRAHGPGLGGVEPQPALSGRGPRSVRTRSLARARPSRARAVGA